MRLECKSAAHVCNEGACSRTEEGSHGVSVICLSPTPSWDKQIPGDTSWPPRESLPGTASFSQKPEEAASVSR